MDTQICSDCKVNEYDADEYTECEDCRAQHAEEQRIVDDEQAWRDGLADLADHLNDSVRCGDMTWSQARASFGAITRRRRS